MTIKGYQVMPSGIPQPEVRANDGKNIKYEYNQLPEDEVFRNRPLTHDLRDNYNTISENFDYFRHQLYERTIDNPYLGNSEMKSFGGRSLELASTHLMGDGSAIDLEVQKVLKRHPAKGSKLVRDFIGHEYNESSQYEEDLSYEDQNMSFSERLRTRLGNTRQAESERPQIFNRSRKAPEKNSPEIPGRQFIKRASVTQNNNAEKELIAKIREKRQQLSNDDGDKQGKLIQKREVNGEKFNFEEI